ncbi:molybdate ABC transporter substrate-binding protein [Sporichthya sp.]|uniref:molybdate ABC transporter substrate-binding protein n=1 Tax=Sporichthya sp. TaxID=65475 RepID=UPI0017B793F0|nr:molybdate ABC transporter substrate-binding protein [Sporichthya sp.]MBA3741813.1 molybdate ABC transporter substrate-binding protein [Sporichthya sp.]
MPRSLRFRRSCTVAAALALTLPLAACSDDDDVASPSGGDTPAPSSKELVVFAAASLTGTFTELGKTFEAAHPGTKVTFNFGSSGTLATQINEGAPADVFASASPATMKTVTDAGNGAGTAVTFVKNRLEIAVPTGNPGKVEGIEDFADDDLDIALCADTAPCGSAADKMFAAAKITPKPDTREADVKAVLTKVEAGEVDAALVYHTDVLAAADGKVESIEFDESDLAINDYLISALKDSDEADLAADWVEFIQTDDAQDVLTGAGFESAEGSATASPSASATSTSSSSSEDEESTEPSESPSATSTS